MTKWPAKKQHIEQRIKHAEHQDTTDIQKKQFCAFFVFLLFVFVTKTKGLYLVIKQMCPEILKLSKCIR